MPARSTRKTSPRKPKGPKGGMQPYDVSIYGGVIQRGSAPLFVMSTVQSDARTAYASLWDITSNNNGDYKQPNNQSYQHKRVIRPNGLIHMYVGHPSSSKTTGPHNSFDGAWPSMGNHSPFENTSSSEMVYWNSYLKVSKSAAYARFSNRLRDSEVNLAVDIAEMRQGVEMIEKRLMDVINLARMARRKAFHISRRNPNDPTKTPWAIIGNTWLEYQYGWRPLLGTVFGLLKHYHQPAEKFRVKGSNKFQTERSFQPPSQNAYGFVSVVRQQVISIAVYSCDYRVNNRALNDLGRLTSLNPIAIAWELVPYSFVADWFVDVGGYLEQWETAQAQGLEFLRGYTTELHKISNTITIPPQTKYFGGWPHAIPSGVKFTENYVWKKRYRLVSTPLPEVPSFEPKLGVERYLSAAALLLNILTKFDRRNRFIDLVPPRSGGG